VRVRKDNMRVCAYGDVDELNAALGVVRAHAPDGLGRLLVSIQRDLFAIGAQLADPSHEVTARREKAAVTGAQVRRLERAIDARETRLAPLRTFVLPGGTPVAALLQQARTVCRRAERAIVRLAREADVDPRILVYLNRLSDLLFVLARFENRQAGEAEHRW
jgi:cob(I)alamin adenosyltransferase